MSEKPRIPLHEELQLANRVADELVAAGVTPEDPDYAELMRSETNIEERLVRILRVARRYAAMSEGLKPIQTDMAVRRDRLDAKVERLRAIVLQAMADTGLSRIEGPDLTASTGSGVQKVVVTDEKAIPGYYFTTVRSLDKRKLAGGLINGSVPGAELSNAPPKLTVRSR